MDDYFEIEGTVTHIISHGLSRKAGSIFLIEPSNTAFGNSVKIKIDDSIAASYPTVGEVWRISGSYDINDNYGDQVLANEAYPTLPSGKILVDFLSNNVKFVGVGRKTAQALWATLGDDLYNTLNDGDINKLTSKVKFLKETVAINLIEKWKEYSELIPIVRYFHSLNFNARIAKKAYEFWGGDTIDRITEDPYRLLAFGNWNTVDSIALSKLNVKADSIIRLIASVEAALYDAYDKQHTALYKINLERKIEKMLGSSITPSEAIEHALEDGRVVKHKDDTCEWIYQNAGTHAIEAYITERIKNIQDGEACQQSLFQYNFTEDKLTNFENTLPFPLAKEQKAAIKMVIENPFGIIVGGAGVGKTTVLNGIYNMLPEHAVIIQAALTNRAASRMKESTGRDAITIAKLLHISANDNLPNNLYLFIDEASMLDAPTFYRILRALPEGTRLYLIGDHHQLPPIGPGLILHRLVQDSHKNVTKLVQVHRQATETGIPIVSDAIRKMTAPNLDKFTSGESGGVGVSFLSCDENNLIDNILMVYRELDSIGEAQVLAARNTTCNNINMALHYENRALREYKNLNVNNIEGYNGSRICEGDKIVYKDNNDMDRELFNGSLGILKSIYDKPHSHYDEYDNEIIYVAEAEFDTSGPIRLTDDDMQHIDLGYAVTVHKAQGSQWDRVIIASEHVSKSSPIVDNTWFYTAITRCQNQAVIVGDESNFNYQVSRPPRSFSRIVGISFKERDKDRHSPCLEVSI